MYRGLVVRTISINEGLEHQPGKGLGDSRTPLGNAERLGWCNELHTAQQVLDRDLLGVHCCSHCQGKVWQQQAMLRCVLHSRTCLCSAAGEWPKSVWHGRRVAQQWCMESCDNQQPMLAGFFSQCWQSQCRVSELSYFKAICGAVVFGCPTA